MRTELRQVPGASACCEGLLRVPQGTTQYWLCGTCQLPCDRRPGPDANPQADPAEQHDQAGTLSVS